HSKFATEKLASMVIGRISRYNTAILNESLGLTDTYANSGIHVFRRYVLINIETVTKVGAERPVRKFTFQSINANNQFPKFLPGDYLELMCHVEGQVVVRPYTPIQGSSLKSFSILIKIYEDGLLSQYLDRQLKGFEIKVRGPFDIGE
ncbi:10087_t:CDS:2, partial [Acaulospora morrowiae]